MEIYIYFKNGNVFNYEVENTIKAREHSEKIWTFGFRANVGNRIEWFGPHYIDKICWDRQGDSYLEEKYNA